MSMKKYIKRPIIVEAVQFNGMNFDELVRFAGNDVYKSDHKICIHTLEGDLKMKNEVGDYLVKGVRGEFYFCEKSIFEETYQEVDEN